MSTNRRRLRLASRISPLILASSSALANTGTQLPLSQIQAGTEVTTGNVVVNGGLFATITGSATSGTAVSYTITGPGGRALTAEEREAIEQLFEAPSRLDQLITLLFEPLSEIFGAYNA